MLYECETWRITERSRRVLEVAEMDAIRRSMRISRKERIRNEEIKQRMEGLIMDDIKRKQLVWYGYVQTIEEVGSRNR